MNRNGEMLWANLAKWVVLFTLLVIIILFVSDIYQASKDIVGSLF